jgi:hypothetical protein
MHRAALLALGGVKKSIFYERAEHCCKHLPQRFLLAMLTGAISALSWAQTPPANPSTLRGVGAGLVAAAANADAAVASITALVQQKTAPEPIGGTSTSSTQLSQVERYLESSAAAKAFYEKYPSDRRASDMKKQEVVYLLHAVQLGASDYRAQLTTLATAYRANKSNSDRDRFEVAFLVAGGALAEKLGGKRFIDDGAAYEKLADDLYAEFGDMAEVYGLYLSILRTTDMATSTRVAGRMIAGKKTPAAVQTQAQLVLARSQLVGKALDLKITGIGGGVIDLAKANDRPTVVFVTNATDGPLAFQALEKFKAATKTDVRWLHLVLGAKPPISDGPTPAVTSGPLAGSYCFESADFAGPAATKLKVIQTPYVYVTNTAGTVTGYGPVENIPALVQAATR